jgi:hypothetical protein
VGGQPCAVAVTDLNGDEIQDLAIGNCGSSEVSVLLGKGAGTFSAAQNYSVGALYSLAAGDLNHDGAPDLAIATGAGNVAILINDGNGGMNPPKYYPAGSTTTGIALADLDQDGAVDLAIANLASPELVVLWNLGDGTFSAETDFDGPRDGAFSIATGDLNGDGIPDLVWAGDYSVRVGLNAGYGDFSSPQSLHTGGTLMNVALADFNLDGALDIAVSTWQQTPVSIFLNQGGGSFGTSVDYQYAGYRGIIATDVDADGHPDLAFTTGSDVRVFLNEFPDRKFSQFLSVGSVVHSWPDALAAADFDGDGKPDLVLAYPNDNTVGLMLTRCGSL